MSTMADDDINRRIDAGQRTIEMAREDTDEVEARRVPTAVVAAGIGVALVGIGLIGWMLYRSRRRRTLLEQLQSALPERVSELRDLSETLRGELRERGGDLRERLKKAL
jgi:hypothetical protein